MATACSGTGPLPARARTRHGPRAHAEDHAPRTRSRGVRVYVGVANAGDILNQPHLIKSAPVAAPMGHATRRVHKCPLLGHHGPRETRFSLRNEPSAPPWRRVLLAPGRSHPRRAHGKARLAGRVRAERCRGRLTAIEASTRGDVSGPPWSRRGHAPRGCRSARGRRPGTTARPRRATGARPRFEPRLRGVAPRPEGTNDDRDDPDPLRRLRPSTRLRAAAALVGPQVTPLVPINPE